MAYDRNPKFGQDQAFTEGAQRVADFLWENAGGDNSSFPRSYLESLRYEFSDGRVSMLELIDRVDLGPDATYEDYCEVVDALMERDPNLWPENLDDVVEIQPFHLLYEIEADYDFSEFDFADEVEEEEIVAKVPGGEVKEAAVVEQTQSDDFSEKMELFLKKVISSVYLEGVTEVTDAQGNPPNASNNYLMSADGKQFSGIFYDSPPNEQARRYPFTIVEDQQGVWQIRY
jgi:hypothetical protein